MAKDNKHLPYYKVNRYFIAIYLAKKSDLHYMSSKKSESKYFNKIISFENLFSNEYFCFLF